jgi:Lrp/AsnC family transcriptional regulator for asnA, asnC and gidA
MTEDIDAKDLEILKMLRKDSRTPLGTIGESLRISKATVSRRIARMEEDGIIQGYNLSLGTAKMGLMKAMVAFQVVGGPVSMVIEQLSQIKEIKNMFKSFGDHHLVCEVYTKNVDHLYELIQSKLLNMPSIRNIEVDVLVEKTVRNHNADLDVYAEHNKIK